MSGRKKKKFLMYIILLAIAVSVPISAAAETGGDNDINQTNVSQLYYITINPIRNYAIGEVFLISGTTNLPVGKTLSIIAYSREADPSGRSPFYGFYVDNIPVISSSQTNNGTNNWRINVTDQVKENLVSGGYLAVVRSSQDDDISNGSNAFYLLPASNSTSSTIPQTTIQSPSLIPSLISPTTSIPTTTQSSPLPMVLPIAIIAALAIVRSVYRRKR